MNAFALKADCLLLVIYIVQIEKIERKNSYRIGIKVR